MTSSAAPSTSPLSAAEPAGAVPHEQAPTTPAPRVTASGPSHGVAGPPRTAAAVDRDQPQRDRKRALRVRPPGRRSRLPGAAGTPRRHASTTATRPTATATTIAAHPPASRERAERQPPARRVRRSARRHRTAPRRRCASLRGHVRAVRNNRDRRRCRLSPSTCIPRVPSGEHTDTEQSAWRRPAHRRCSHPRTPRPRLHRAPGPATGAAVIARPATVLSMSCGPRAGRTVSHESDSDTPSIHRRSITRRSWWEPRRGY